MSPVLALLLVTISLVAAISPIYTHHAILDNIQASTPSTAWGAAVISFSRVTGVLQYTLVNNVTQTTAAHIHGPAVVGQSAGVIVAIPGFDAGSNPSATGNVTIPPANYDDIDNGRTYFNIHTTAFPNGEIRGQILAIGQQISSLTAAQANSTSNATGVAWTDFDPSSSILSLVLNHNVQNPTAVHIHGPAPMGVSAGVVFTIAADSTAAAKIPYNNSFTLTATQAQWLANGLLYYNVHSAAFPNGEVRGQIWPIVNYLAELNGQQDGVTTSSLGVGAVALYGSALWSAIYHTVPNPTAAHIHTAPRGIPGPVTFPYANPMAQPIQQMFNGTADQITLLQNGTDYFNIHTAAAPNGLIRGQILAKQATATSTTTGTTTNSTATSSTSSTTGGVSTTTSKATSSTSSSSTTSPASTVLASLPVLVMAIGAVVMMV